MKIPFRMFRQFPKWVATIAIIGCSILAFSCWWMLRGARHRSSPIATSTNRPAKRLQEFKLEHTILCGNTLVDVQTGQVISEHWLEGFGDTPPPIARVLADERLVLCSENGKAAAFDFDGNALPPLRLDGKALKSAAFSFSDSRLLFVKAGNIWRGTVDWRHSSICEASRITDTGYFRDDAFSGSWFWRQDLLLLPIAGRTHRVDLATGAVSQEAVNVESLGRGCSPDHNLAAIPSGTGKFWVMDFASGETKELPIRGRLNQGLWIENDRLAYVSGHSDLMIYDARSGESSSEITFSSPVQKLLAASPEGSCILASSRQQLVQIDITSKRLTPIDVPLEEVEWSPDEGALIGSCRSTNTGLRGIWRLSRTGELAHIGSQPADPAQGNEGRRPMIATKAGVVWISCGNLWSLSLGDQECRQITRGLHLSASLQELSKKP